MRKKTAFFAVFHPKIIVSDNVNRRYERMKKRRSRLQHVLGVYAQCAYARLALLLGFL